MPPKRKAQGANAAAPSVPGSTPTSTLPPSSSGGAPMRDITNEQPKTSTRAKKSTSLGPDQVDTLTAVSSSGSLKRKLYKRKEKSSTPLEVPLEVIDTPSKVTRGKNVGIPSHLPHEVHFKPTEEGQAPGRMFMEELRDNVRALAHMYTHKKAASPSKDARPYLEASIGRLAEGEDTSVAVWTFLIDYFASNVTKNRLKYEKDFNKQAVQCETELESSPSALRAMWKRICGEEARLSRAMDTSGPSGSRPLDVRDNAVFRELFLSVHAFRKLEPGDGSVLILAEPFNMFVDQIRLRYEHLEGSSPASGSTSTSTSASAR